MSIRPEDDHYPTPEEVTRALLSVERFPGDVWEPCSGYGGMAAIIREAGYTVTATTLLGSRHDRNAPKHRVIGDRDFLNEKKLLKPNIVTNPPFNISTEIINHAIELGADKIAMLLDLKFLSGGARWGYPGNGPSLIKGPSRFYPIVNRVSFYPADYEGKRNSTTQNYAWFIWDTSCKGPMIEGAKLYTKDFQNLEAAQ